MCNQWAEAKLFKFLKLYKRYECLWNPYSSEYENCDAKSEAFTQIINEMNVIGLTVNECLKQIKYIRETYKKEQHKLENLTVLGGRASSNILWYSSMNSMLSKVVQDEEKLNQGSGNLDLVIVPKHVPPHFGDLRRRKRLCRNWYCRKTSSSNHTETMAICPYDSNSDYRDPMNNYHRSPAIFNDSNILCTGNDHISSCPTCGYSSGSFCNCFSTNNGEYNSYDSSQFCSSQSQINYRPRTSYNYRNGILEINSAVRIPVSEPSQNYGYNHYLERITPEDEPQECAFLDRSNMQNIEEEDDFSTDCCTECLCKKSSGLIEITQNSICTIENPGINATTNEHSLDVINQENSNADVGSRTFFCCHDNTIQSSNFQINKNEHPMIESNLSELKMNLFAGKDFTQPARYGQFKNEQSQLNSPLSEKMEKSTEPSHSIAEICNVKNTDLVQKSDNVVKKNLAKIVVDLINNILNNPADKNMKVDIKDKLILKKVAQDLRAVSKGDNLCISKENRDHELVQENQTTRTCNKTICWREPIEESLNPCNKPSKTIRCKFTSTSSDQTDCNESIPSARPMHLPAGISCKNQLHCFRMIAGADCDLDSDVNRCDSLKLQKNIISPKNTDQGTSFEDLSHISATEKAEDDNDTPQNCGKHFAIEVERNGADKYRGDDVQGKADFLQYNEVFQRKHFEYTTKIAPDLLVSSDDNRESLCVDRGKSEDVIEVEHQIRDIQHVSPTKGCEEVDNLEYCGSNSTFVESIYLETSQGSDTEALDKVVNNVTNILRETLDKNGYAIERKQFFSKKSLITNDNGDINRTLIQNEAAWNTELRSIISDLIKNNKTGGNTITFKVKTMILPVKSASDTTSKDVTSHLSSLRTKQISRNALAVPQIDKSIFQEKLNGHEIFSKDQERFPENSRSKCQGIMKRSESTVKLDPEVLRYSNGCKQILYCKADKNKNPFGKNSSLNQMRRFIRRKRKIMARHNSRDILYTADKIPINDAHRIILPDDPNALRKLMKYLVKFKDRYHDVPTKYDKSLFRRGLENDECATLNDKRANLDGVVQNYHSNEFLAPDDHNTSPWTPKKNIYLCTEISQAGQTTQQNEQRCNCSSSNSGVYDNLKKDLNSRVQKTVSERDSSEWESFSDSDEEIELAIQKELRGMFTAQNMPKRPTKSNIFGNSNVLSENLNKKNYSINDYLLRHPDILFTGGCPVYALNETTRGTFISSKCDNEVAVSDSIEQTSSNECLLPSQAKDVKNTRSGSQNILNINDTNSSSNRQNCTSQKHGLRSDRGSKVSLGCEALENIEEANDTPLPHLTESQEGQSLLDEKLKIMGNNHIKSCCTGNKTSSICTPICDLTSRLRLCAIMEPPNDSASENYDTSSKPISCCCKETNKLKTVKDEVYSKSETAISVEDPKVRLSPGTCDQPLKTDLHLRERENQAVCVQNSDDRGKSHDRLDVTSHESKMNLPINKDVKQLDNVEDIAQSSDHYKSPTIKRDTVQSNLNSLPVVLEVPSLQDGPLLVEIKMLQPLFSIEFKQAHTSIVKTELLDKQCSCKLLEKNNPEELLLSRESEIKSSPEDSLSSLENGDLDYINKTTSTNTVSGVQRVSEKDSGIQQKSGEDTPTCGVQSTQNWDPSCDTEKSMNTSNGEHSNSVDCNVYDENVPRNCKENWGTLDPDIHFILLDTLGSFKNQQKANNDTNASATFVDNCVMCAETAMPNRSAVERPKSKQGLKSQSPQLLITQDDVCKNSKKSKSVPTSNATQNIEEKAEGVISSNDRIKYNEKKITDPSNSQLDIENSSGPISIKNAVINKSSQESQVMFPIPEIAYSQHKLQLILSQQRTSLSDNDHHKHERERRVPKSKIVKAAENVSEFSLENSILSDEAQNKLRDNKCSVNILNYDTSNEMIYCGVKEKTTDSRKSMNESLSKYEESDCWPGDSIDVDIDAFVSTVASQLRGLSIEAALRSQQRIQTLISNSRLKSEKNRTYNG